MFLKVSLPIVLGLAFASGPASADPRSAPAGTIPANTGRYICGGAINQDGTVATVGNGPIRFDTTRVQPGPAGVYDVVFKNRCGNVQASSGAIRIVQPELLNTPGVGQFQPPVYCTVQNSPKGPNAVRVQCYRNNNAGGGAGVFGVPFDTALL